MRTSTSTPTGTAIEMNELVLPQHTNALGTVFGGVIMSWIDVCAAIAAQRHSRSVVVTASMDQLDFLAPIQLGYLVNLKAMVNYVGRTSMEVGVRVEAEETQSGRRVHAASSYLTFVAIDADGKSREVPPLRLETEQETLRFKEGRARREKRLSLARVRQRLAADNIES